MRSSPPSVGSGLLHRSDEPGAPGRRVAGRLQRIVRRLLPAVTLAALALGSSATGLANGFAYDDVPVIRENPRVHTLADPVNFFVTSYWPRDHGGALYRPLTLLGFALEWAAGGGSPRVFHLVNLLLYLALGLAVCALARRILPAGPAWIAAAIFAVHPVHVEAVGNVVGQSELLVALYLSLGVLLYLRARRAADLRARESVALFGLTLLAGLTKESGLMLPALVAAAEVLVVDDPRPLRERARVLATTGLLLGVALAIVIAMRRFALDALVGEYPAVALRGLGGHSRLLTMLGVAPEWFRLLLWPARLSAEYGPPELDAATGFGARQALGLLLLGLAAGAGLAARRRAPAVTLGIVWAAVALFPVSNLAVATGVLVAERTLMLPSVGLALACGGAASAVRPLPREARLAALAALTLLLALGLARSAARQRVWRDTPTVLLQTLRDAPENFRAWKQYGMYLKDRGQLRAARAALEQSARMYQGDAGVYEELGLVRRRQDGCARAAPYFERALAIDPDRSTARGRLYLCLLEQGDTVRARAVAAEGAELGSWYFQLQMKILSSGPAARPAPVAR